MLNEEVGHCTAAPAHLATDDSKEAAVWGPGNERLAGGAAAKAPSVPLHIVKELQAKSLHLLSTSNCKSCRAIAAQAI